MNLLTTITHFVAIAKQTCIWTGIGCRLFGLRLWYWKPSQTVVFFNRALQLLRNENILFTKIFQSLANSKNVSFSPDLRAQLLHYTTNTSYTESEVDYETLDAIETQHGIQIDRRVVNSGMIALIFKDITGSYVIKLKRRGIREALHHGCESVKFIYTVASSIAPHNRILRILKPFIQNIDDIVAQCDFEHEIANLRKAKEDFADLSATITIPTVFNTETSSSSSSSSSSPSDPSYILMNCIQGTHLLPPTVSESERLVYLRYFCEFMCHGFLYNTIQHTDLHSGNIIFTPTGLGIIDFGMAFQPDEDIHDSILSVIEIIVKKIPIHEIDFIHTFRHIFIPSLDRKEITNPNKVEDVCIAVTEPLLNGFEVDELSITDNIDSLSEHLGREIVLHKDLYRIILGMAMMGNNAVIMGPGYKNLAKIQEIEKAALRNVCRDLL